jgi:hypothetical protein
MCSNRSNESLAQTFLYLHHTSFLANVQTKITTFKGCFVELTRFNTILIDFNH